MIYNVFIKFYFCFAKMLTIANSSIFDLQKYTFSGKNGHKFIIFR